MIRSAIAASKSPSFHLPFTSNIDYNFSTVQAGMPMTVKGEGRADSSPFAFSAACRG
jgi:hypothetical protein